MNADLMITIAFCLYVLVGSLAVGFWLRKASAKTVRKRPTRSDALPAASLPTRAEATVERGCRRRLPTGGVADRGYRSNNRSRATRSGERPAAVWLGPEKDRK